MLKHSGALCWIGCLLTLGYQGLMWLIHGTWPSLTLMDALRNLNGSDLASIMSHLSFGLAIKITYVALTTELALALWWLGVGFFVLFAVLNVVRGR